MSEQTLELIRTGFAAHNRGDLDALVELDDPDVVFETLLLGTMDGDRFAFPFTIRDGRVIREQAFRNRDEALEAARGS